MRILESLVELFRIESKKKEDIYSSVNEMLLKEKEKLLRLF